MPGSGGRLDKSASEIKYIRALQHGLLTGLMNGRKWFFLIDDDTFLAPYNLYRFIHNYKLNYSNIDFFGQLCGYAYPGSGDLTVNRVCGGGGMLISQGLAIKLLGLLQCCFNYDNAPYSDVFISFCILGEIDSTAFKAYSTLFHSQAYDHPEFDIQSWEHAISWHYAKPKEKHFDLYKLYKSFAPD
jgi:hypothetical protein